jgi:hypothetical protein
MQNRPHIFVRPRYTTFSSIRIIALTVCQFFPRRATISQLVSNCLQWQTDNYTRYDKHDAFDFAIVNFPFLCSNIPLSPAYGVYISQLIRYARACFAYEVFSKQGKLLTDKLMLQGSFRKLYSRYNDIVCDYKSSLAHVSYILLDCRFQTGFDDG